MYSQFSDIPFLSVTERNLKIKDIERLGYNFYNNKPVPKFVSKLRKINKSMDYNKSLRIFPILNYKKKINDNKLLFDILKNRLGGKLGNS